MIKRLAFGTLTVAVALSLSGCSLLYPNQKPPVTASPKPSQTSSEAPKPTPTKDPVLNSVEVTILSSSADLNAGIEVIAQALNVSEDGGTCTLTVSQAGTKKSVSAKAESNVTDTQCFPLSLPVVGFAPGAATFTVSYKSATSSGLSAINQIVIP